ncbi:MAG: ABC transporter ATP-binding protein [Micromonosporaceae bacterium]
MDATPKTSAAAIRLDGVRKQYPGGTVAVAELTLDVSAGELVVLVGPSGCGKSTVLRMINRLIEPSSGRVLLDDEDVTKASPVALRRRIGYVIQNVGLFPHQTVRQNVATVPRLLGWSRQAIADRVEELLDLVGLDSGLHGKRYPHELSGGQRQRVGLARALGADPAVLLMDEPFSAVDPIVRARLQEEFLRLQESVRKTIVFVTHDVDEAVRLGDRIVVLSEGGKLEQHANPATVLGRPASSFVAEFVGADRGIKRLAVTPVPRDLLRPLSTVNGSDSAAPTGPLTAAETPSVRVTATLRDALAELLEGGTGWVAVRDGDERLGVLTPEDIYTALHRDR